MSTSKRGWGTVEFIACREEVAKLLLAGHTLTAIHQVLKKTGKISMGYSRFYALVGRYKLLKPVLPWFFDEIAHSSKDVSIKPVPAVLPDQEDQNNLGQPELSSGKLKTLKSSLRK